MRRSTWIALLLLTLTALLVVAIPVSLIRPFTGQTEDAIAISHFLRRWSPAVTLLIALTIAALTALRWRQVPGWQRLGLVTALALTVGTAWFARQRHFEWMFAPLASPEYARAAATDWVEPRDMVLAVTMNGDAVAYPVRQLAYHHLVQDMVGGVPIVATY